MDLELDTSKVDALVDHLRTNTDRKLAIKMLADMLAGDDDDFVIEIKRKGKGKPRDERKIVLMITAYEHLIKNNSKAEARRQVADLFNVSTDYVKQVVQKGI